MSWPRLWIAAFLIVQIVLAGMVQAAPTAVVTSPLTGQEVRTAVERFLAERLEGRGWETSIRQLVVPQGIVLPRGPRDLEVIAPESWDGWGPVSLALVIRVNGAVERNISLRLLVEARTEMVVATRQLLGGTVPGPDDLQLQWREVAQAGGLHVRSVEDVVGKKLRTMVRSGAPVRSNQLEKVPVVKSGQLVTIVAENQGIRVTVTGRAKSSGGVGDLIRVENLLSRKEFPARIVDSATVEVGF